MFFYYLAWVFVTSTAGMVLLTLFLGWQERKFQREGGTHKDK